MTASGGPKRAAVVTLDDDSTSVCLEIFLGKTSCLSRPPYSRVRDFLGESVFFYLLIERALCDAQRFGRVGKVTTACVNCRLDRVTFSPLQFCQDRACNCRGGADRG